MPIKINGQVGDFPRYELGCHTLDFLFSKKQKDGSVTLGLPLNTTVELYGAPGSGKSTIATWMAGRVCHLTSATRIRIADIEDAYEPEYVLSNLEQAGFDGEVDFTPFIDKKRKPRSHETVLQETVDALLEPQCGAIIVDSLGMIIPAAEDANPLGSANMGKRAFLINQMNRRILNHLRNTEEPKLAIQVNHVVSVMGGMGHDTPGGDGKKFAAAIRVMVKKISAEKFEDGSIAVELKNEKMRYGGLIPNRKGYLILIPGFGVSPEMTAVYDCFVLGLAERGSFVKVPDEQGKMKSAGRLKELFERAKSGDKEAFVPFYRALSGSNVEVSTNETETEESEE